MGRIREQLVDFRPAEQVSRVHRSIFSDQRIFDLEMKHLFEGGWVFLALESQLPEPNDFLVVRVGRHEILLMRDADHQIGAFYNTCPHRGAQICPVRTGNKRLHVCPYHSWSFNSSGKNRAVKGRASGAYSPAFEEQNHDLHPIARLDSYKGLLFGSLSADVEPLESYLGDTRALLDLCVDQSEDGIEILPGTVTYTYRGNWKHQLENSTDGYHVTSVHPTYMKIARDRATEGRDDSGVDGVWDRLNSITEEKAQESHGGTLGFENGHAIVWLAGPKLPGHPLFERRKELEDRCGPVKSDWMFYLRNLTIFPNLQIAENFSSILRVMRPIAPDLTEMIAYCVAPKGEGADARRLRLRQFEDFFNPAGLATPDDLVAYEGCQIGHHLGGPAGWLQGYERGLTALIDGPTDEARELGIEPLHAVNGDSQIGDETVFQTHYEAWSERLGPDLDALLSGSVG